MIGRFAPALAALLAAVGTTGCEESPRDKLQGTWRGERIDNVPEDQLMRATGWVRGAQLEFKGSKVTITIPAESPRIGSFKIESADETSMMLAFHRPEGGVDRASFTLVGADRMHWHLGDGRQAVLVRDRAEND
jgi:hypothetical protein